jgi:CrcB protein
MADILFVGVGGFVGAALRYGVSILSNTLSFTHSFPFGTLIVNVVGCFAIGALSELAIARGALTEHQRLLLIPGLLGGFTTFSAFGYETMALLQNGNPLGAAGNAAANVGLGLLAVAVGRAAVG